MKVFSKEKFKETQGITEAELRKHEWASRCDGKTVEEIKKMPEIDFCLFDLSKILILFPREDKELRERVLEYEKKAQQDMEQNRWKLFNEFGYGC